MAPRRIIGTRTTGRSISVCCRSNKRSNRSIRVCKVLPRHRGHQARSNCPRLALLPFFPHKTHFCKSKRVDFSFIPEGLTMWLPIPNCGRQPSVGCRETSPSGLDGQFRGKNTKRVLMDNFEGDDIARFLAEDCHISNKSGTA